MPLNPRIEKKQDVVVENFAIENFAAPESTFIKTMLLHLIQQFEISNLSL
jgi:hypothetical protein